MKSWNQSWNPQVLVYWRVARDVRTKLRGRLCSSAASGQLRRANAELVMMRFQWRHPELKSRRHWCHTFFPGSADVNLFGGSVFSGGVHFNAVKQYQGLMGLERSTPKTQKCRSIFSIISFCISDLPWFTSICKNMVNDYQWSSNISERLTRVILPGFSDLPWLFQWFASIFSDLPVFSVIYQVSVISHGDFTICQIVHNFEHLVL